MVEYPEWLANVIPVRVGNSSELIGPGRWLAKGIVGHDQAEPDLNWAAILLAQPDPISSQRASGPAQPYVKKKIILFNKLLSFSIICFSSTMISLLQIML